MVGVGVVVVSLCAIVVGVVVGDVVDAYFVGKCVVGADVCATC